MIQSLSVELFFKKGIQNAILGCHFKKCKIPFIPCTTLNLLGIVVLLILLVFSQIMSYPTQIKVTVHRTI